MKVKNIIGELFILFLAGGCLEPYYPNISKTDKNLLVFEGVNINVFEGIGDSYLSESFVTLSRLQNLSDTAEIIPETNANVSILTIPENTFTFTNIGNGVYYLIGIDWKNYQECKIKITISDEIYESQYTEIGKTPEIDSISWKSDDEGLHIYVNTHDVNNNTWYYRWGYTETAEYHSAYQSYLYWDDERQEVRARPEDELIYRCWSTEGIKDWSRAGSKAILIGTSKGLSSDVISQQKILTLPPESWKHGIKYSILVKQYAISKEAYAYMHSIQKSNDEIGSLFDSQPIDVKGNIKCISNPQKDVIGFFTVSSITQKRKFISRSELPDEWRRLRISQYSGCEDDIIGVTLSDLNKYKNRLITQTVPGPGELIYVLASRYCVDCRLKGGTNKKPDFWE